MPIPNCYNPREEHGQRKLWFTSRWHNKGIQLRLYKIIAPIQKTWNQKHPPNVEASSLKWLIMLHSCRHHDMVRFILWLLHIEYVDPILPSRIKFKNCTVKFTTSFGNSSVLENILHETSRLAGCTLILSHKSYQTSYYTYLTWSLWYMKKENKNTIDRQWLGYGSERSDIRLDQGSCDVK